MAEFSSRSQRVRELCRRLAPFIGKKAEEINLAYLAEDKVGKEQIEIYLEALVSQYLREKSLDGDSNLVPPNASLARGEYAIGDIIYGGRKMGNFGLREKEWIQHLGIFGRTGAGRPTWDSRCCDNSERTASPSWCSTGSETTGT